MTKTSAVLGVLSLFAAAACTMPTPYEPAVNGAGYSEQLLEDNRYRISFAGNSRTPRDTVETYVLFRAAEITLTSGHDYFALADRDTERRTTYRTHVFGGHGFHRYRLLRFHHPFHESSVAGTSIPVNRYRAWVNILVFKGEKPSEDPSAYDARSVIATLRPRIVRAVGQ